MNISNERSGSEKKICCSSLLYQVTLLLILTTLIKQRNHDNLESTLVLNVCLSLSHIMISWPSSWSLIYGVSLIIYIFSRLCSTDYQVTEVFIFVHYTSHWYMGVVPSDI